MSREISGHSRSSVREVLGHSQSVKILVILNPTGYMLTSSGAVFIRLRVVL